MKNTKKDTIMTREDEKNEDNKNCRLCENEISSNKVGDHCHLTGNYRGPAQKKTEKTLHRNKATLFQLSFVTSVMIVMYSSKID